jgi:protein SCO1/2
MTRLVVLPMGLSLLFAAAARSQPAEPAPSIGIEQRLDEKIPLDLVFRDEQNRSVRLGDFFGKKPVILVLAYYRCPRLCSIVLNGLVGGLRQVDYEIGNEFTVLTVSIDPREQPELAAAKKAAYVEQYGRPGAAAGWYFLTGDEPNIKRLAEAIGYKYAYDTQRDEFAHGSGIMMLTPDGTLSRYFYGIRYSPQELRYGLEDSSAGKIGSPVVRPLRLLCFTYDPVTGTYTLMTMRLMRVAGTLTVLAVACYLLRAWRRERRAPKLSPSSSME